MPEFLDRGVPVAPEVIVARVLHRLDGVFPWDRRAFERDHAVVVHPQVWEDLMLEVDPGRGPAGFHLRPPRGPQDPPYGRLYCLALPVDSDPALRLDEVRLRREEVLVNG